MQPFKLEISSDNTSTADTIIQNEENHNGDISILETTFIDSVGNDHHMHSNTKEENNDPNENKQPVPPFPSIHRANSLVNSTVQLSSL